MSLIVCSERSRMRTCGRASCPQWHRRRGRRSKARTRARSTRLRRRRRRATSVRRRHTPDSEWQEPGRGGSGRRERKNVGPTVKPVTTRTPPAERRQVRNVLWAVECLGPPARASVQPEVSCACPLVLTQTSVCSSRTDSVQPWASQSWQRGPEPSQHGQDCEQGAHHADEDSDRPLS